MTVKSNERHLRKKSNALPSIGKNTVCLVAYVSETFTAAIIRAIIATDDLHSAYCCECMCLV